MINTNHRSHRTETSTNRTKQKRKASKTIKRNSNENRIASSVTAGTTCFTRCTILCLAFAGLLIFRYPSFIHENMKNYGKIVLKLDDVATTPLRPEIESLYGLDHYYMFPPANATSTGDPKGILLYLHSCQKSGLDFFTLPEHRIFAISAIQQGMIVFAPTSYNRASGCFTSEDVDWYLEKVVDGFIRNHQLHQLPRFGLGDSSGGSLLLFVHRALKLESMAVYNSPQGYVDSDINAKEVIPTVYLTMTSDGIITERTNANILKLQEMNVSAKLYTVSPRPFTESLCPARLPELPPEFCRHIFQTIEREYSNLLGTHGNVIEGDVTSEQWQHCFKKLESDYKISSTTDTFDNLISYGNEKNAASTTEAKSWLRVILEQEIQTCYGYHAMTAQFHNEILTFLLSNARMNRN